MTGKKLGRDLAPGDVLAGTALGGPRLITSIRPYRPSRGCTAPYGPGTKYLVSPGGWEMTIDPNRQYAVAQVQA